ncbi:MAG: hypothetical protein ACE5R6_09215 [Candidatus Heimdallarchaeota archaeon]
MKQLYETRWQIEILSRVVKQAFGLKTKRPIGRTLNAVLVQIYCAVITYQTLSIYRQLVCGGMTVFDLLRQIKYMRKRLSAACPPWELRKRCPTPALAPQEVT